MSDLQVRTMRNATRVTHLPAPEVVEGERTGRFDRAPAPVEEAQPVP